MTKTNEECFTCISCITVHSGKNITSKRCGIFIKWENYKRVRNICPCRNCIIKSMCHSECDAFNKIHTKIFGFKYE